MLNKILIPVPVIAILGAGFCEVTPTPNPTPTPTVEPTPEPTPTPIVSSCPSSCLGSDVQVYLGSRPYGQGFDSSVRLRGSKACCAALGHQNPSQDCHLEGYPDRLACELELMGNKCAIWQYQVAGVERVFPCEQVGEVFSCDHFGSTSFRDDPATPPFEGKPEICGNQRDDRGHPKAGFFTIAHGLGQVRACLPDGTGCSGWHEVNH